MHTPYDGSHKPFAIGLKPLDLKEWIEVDDKFDIYLAEKKRLYTEQWSNVYAAVPGMDEAEQEVLDLLIEHLSNRHPGEGRGDASSANLKRVAKPGPGLRRDDERGGRDDERGGRDDGTSGDLPDLAKAGLLVQEDLVIMTKRGDYWCLGAASLCFPSAWSLREKLGKPMHEVHGPVPGFNKGTRNAGLIDRMFDNLRVEQPVVRWNWTLFGQDKLYHPVSEGGMKRRFGDGKIAERIFLRLERQTLRKLPKTGEILFTIRTHIDPVAVLETHADGAALAGAVAEQVRAFSAEELAYKGMTQERDQVLARFERIATAA
jgi:dimethylamine monooxygenase subunit A